MQVSLRVAGAQQIPLEVTGGIFIPQVGDDIQLPEMNIPATVKSRVFVYNNPTHLTVRLNLGYPPH